MAWYFRKLVVTFQRNLADPHVTMRDALRSAIADVVPVDILAMLQDPKEIATNHWSPSSRLDALTAGLTQQVPSAKNSHELFDVAGEVETSDQTASRAR